MQFKLWLLNERLYETMPDGYTVYLNPTIDELTSLHSSTIRGFLDDRGNVFVWNSYAGTHESISKYLNERVYVAFALVRSSSKTRPFTIDSHAPWRLMVARYSTPTGNLKIADKTLLDNKNLQRMLLGVPELIDA